MKLRYSTTSPYVRKVTIAAQELGLTLARAPAAPWDPDTDLPKENPLGKVPSLTADDGTVYFDSPVICEYLDSLAPGKLFPAGHAARLPALRLQAAADGILDAAVLRLLEGRRPPELQMESWRNRQQAAVSRTLDWLEAEISAGPEPFHIGHIAVVCALGYLDFRFAAEDWRVGRPRLAAWWSQVENRPSVRETVPEE